MTEIHQGHRADMPRSRFADAPAEFLQNWQDAGLRVLRAQERVLHGVLSATKLQMQFGQELMESRVKLMQKVSTPDETGGLLPAHQVERMVSVMRDVTQTLSESYRDAAKYLSEGFQHDAQKAAELGGDVMQAATQRATDAMHDSTEAAARMAKKATVKTAKMPDAMADDDAAGTAPD